ncbi:MAG: tetratricopeptide repeat protein [Methylococcales bacterium]|nr:tetratricopeptide repeat protein [Methylococcales bacterium]
MALATCKECKNEVSTEAKTCAYCGVDNPAVINNHRRVGLVVLTLIIFLCTYLLTKNDGENNPYKDVKLSGKKETGVVKTDQGINATQSPPEQSKPMPTEAATDEASMFLPQSSVQTTPESSASRDQPEQRNLEPDKKISSADTPQLMVMHMLAYALKDGGLGHELEIQQTKLQIESLPRPIKGNKKAARAINAKGLELSRQGDFERAAKMFKEANKLDKADTEIVNNLGYSYLRQGNLKSAQQAITLALAMSPDRATAWENLGEVFAVKGNLNMAVACFSNAFRFSQDKLKMHRYMQKLNEKEEVKNLKKARAKAINWAEKSYLKNPNNTESRGKARADVVTSKK